MGGAARQAAEALPQPEVPLKALEWEETEMKRLIAAAAFALSLAAPCWAKPIHFFYFVYVTPTFYPDSGATPYYDGPIQISRAYKNYDKCIEGMNEFRWIGINGAPPSVSVCYEVDVRGVVGAPPAAPTLELPQQ